MNSRFATLALAAALVSAASVQAQITPAGTFGSLPANSFGGSGIPTNSVMLGGVNGATLGLSATARYTSPTVTNNGAGTYYAAPGESTGGPSNTGFASWNFDYYVNKPSNSTDIFTLYVDGDPATGNSLGDATTNSFVLGVLPANYFDSSNLKYGWTFPASFNPNTPGQYSFALYQRSAAGEELSHVAMNVNVGTVPEPSSLALLGSGFVGLAGFVKRRGKLG